MKASRRKTFAAPEPIEPAGTSPQRDVKVDAKQGYYAQRRRFDRAFIEVVVWVIVALIALVAVIAFN